MNIYISELPDDTPVVDLHKLADLDFSKLSKIEKSGERMLRDVQEWMIQERSSSECAVLPEDKIQRIMVGVRIFRLVCSTNDPSHYTYMTIPQIFSIFFFLFQACNQLEIACLVKQTALNLRWDAVKVMKAALTGTATTKFVDVLEAAFGEEENKEEVSTIVPTEKEKEETLPKEAVLTKSEADTEFFDQPEASTSATGTTKRATRSASKQPPVKRSRKQDKPSKTAGPYILRGATPLHPTRADQNTYLHTGVPDEFISDRESGPFSKVAIYKCNYARVMRERGFNPAECDVICQSRGQTSTHIRQFHLNNCMECYICSHRWWSAFEWKKHMKKVHTDLTKDDWYVASDTSAADLSIKREVTEEELLEEMRVEEQDDE